MEKEKPRAWICSDLGVLIDFRGKSEAPSKKAANHLPSHTLARFLLFCALVLLFLSERKKGNTLQCCGSKLVAVLGHRQLPFSKEGEKGAC